MVAITEMTIIHVMIAQINKTVGQSRAIKSFDSFAKYPYTLQWHQKREEKLEFFIFLANLQGQTLRLTVILIMAGVMKLTKGLDQKPFHNQQHPERSGKKIPAPVPRQGRENLVLARTGSHLFPGRPSHLMVLSEHLREFVANEEVQSEFLLFKNAFRQDSDLLQQPTYRLIEAAGPMADTLPNLARLAAVGLLLPTSTADCERGFSTLKRVKTPLRNRLCNGTLQNLLMISIEGEETLNFDYSKAVNKWAAMKRRRLSVK